MSTKVLDTNVLLDRPIEQTLSSFDPCKIVIPLAVVSELDKFKGLDDARGFCARQAIRFLDSLRPNLHQGILLTTGHTIVVEVNHIDVELPDFLVKTNTDSRILAISKGMQEEDNDDVSLITQDICVRIMADALGIKAENYVVEHVEVDKLYAGWTKVIITDNEVQSLYENGYFRPTIKFIANQYLAMTDSTGGIHYGRYITEQGIIRSIKLDIFPFGVSPAENNIEQVFLLDALLDNKIQLVSVLGPAGTGKTLLALAAGLHQVVNTGYYDKLVVTRELIPHGRDIGALPGTKEEKVGAWMGSLYDNLQYLVRNFSAGKYDEKTPPSQKVTKFLEEEYIELEALTYIRGRSIPNQWIIVDEAQNLTKENIKTIITRAGKGTKVVVIGDIEQIDNCRLTATNNGLVTLIDRFKGQEIYAHVSLSRSERSVLAGLGVKLLP